MSHLSKSESDTGGGVDWAMTGLAALLGSVCWFCDRAAVARGSALSAE